MLDRIAVIHVPIFCPNVIKTADYIIDLGPEGGNKGGCVIAKGTPEEVAANNDSYTGQFLKPLLAERDGR